MEGNAGFLRSVQWPVCPQGWELGFVPFDRTGGELLFNLLTDRYERRATVITTNLAFAEWVTVFAGDEKLTTALLDRLAHHATVLTTKGNSYRCDSTPSPGRRSMPRRTRTRLPVAGALVRRPRQPEARPLVDLSDFQSAELSDFRPALTLAHFPTGARTWRCVGRQQEPSRHWPDTRTWGRRSAICT